jgi:hypothetical protein
MASPKSYEDGGRSRDLGKESRRGRSTLVFTSCRESPLVIGYLVPFQVCHGICQVRAVCLFGRLSYLVCIATESCSCVVI